jgi:gluconokinase
MIVVVAGVSGSGKTTVGTLLAGRLDWAFADADSFHTAVCVAKMHTGIPLTDDDRWPWLAAIGAWMDERIAAGESAVVACSALKRAYRDRLRAGRPDVRVVFLTVGHDADEERVTHRPGHFFPHELVDSQFAALELPLPDEAALVLPADGTPAELTDQIISALRLPRGQVTST